MADIENKSSGPEVVVVASTLAEVELVLERIGLPGGEVYSSLNNANFYSNQEKDSGSVDIFRASQLQILYYQTSYAQQKLIITFLYNYNRDTQNMTDRKRVKINQPVQPYL